MRWQHAADLDPTLLLVMAGNGHRWEEVSMTMPNGFRYCPGITDSDEQDSLLFPVSRQSSDPHERWLRQARQGLLRLDASIAAGDEQIMECEMLVDAIEDTLDSMQERLDVLREEFEDDDPEPPAAA